MFGDGQLRRFAPMQDVQLEERIEIHYLYARTGIQGVAFDVFGHETLRGADRLRIAVAVRRAEQPAVGVEERHVHAPGIDADGMDGKAGFGRLFHALADLAEKRFQVPVQMAAVFDDPVREAVHLFELQPPAGQRAEHRPAAGRAEVECQKMVGFHGDAIRPGAAPCPSRAGNCRPR